MIPTFARSFRQRVGVLLLGSGVMKALHAATNKRHNSAGKAAPEVLGVPTMVSVAHLKGASRQAMVLAAEM